MCAYIYLTCLLIPFIKANARVVKVQRVPRLESILSRKSVRLSAQIRKQVSIRVYFLWRFFVHGDQFILSHFELTAYNVILF